MAYPRRRGYSRPKYVRRRRSRNPSRFPSSTFGKVYLPRGTELTTTQFGRSVAEATGDQLRQRYETGYRGRGGLKRFARKHATLANAKKLYKLAEKSGAIDYAMDAGMAAFPEAAPAMMLAEGQMSKYAGRGAYDHTTNQLFHGGPSSAFQTSGDETNDIVISRCEYIKDIVPTSVGFQTQYNANLNPGLSDSYPWLSQIACYFEEYEWVQLVYELRSMVTEGNTTSAGTLIHATQYNPANGLFTTKQRMENYEYAQSHKVTDHGHHGVECDPDKRSGNSSEYVRTGPLASNQDIKTYDLGIYQLCTSGAVANLNLGELWVHYTVKLKKTKIPDPGSIVQTVAQFSAASAQINNTQLGNTVWTVSSGSSITPTFTGASPLVITMPSTMTAAVSYDVLVGFTGTTTASGVNQNVANLNCVGTNCTVTQQPFLAGSFQQLTGVFGGVQVTGGTNLQRFTPNGSGAVVLSYTLGSLCNIPPGGSIIILVSPSAL